MKVPKSTASIEYRWLHAVDGLKPAKAQEEPAVPTPYHLKPAPSMNRLPIVSYRVERVKVVLYVFK